MQITAVETEGTMRLALRRHFLLIVIVGLYAAIIWSIPSSHFQDVSVTSLRIVVENFAVTIPQIVCIILIWRLFHATYVVKPVDRSDWIKEDILAFLRDRERLVSGVLAATVVSFGFATYARGKSLIPILNPFSWDETFMQLDKTLHLGTQPFEILDGLFSSDLMLTVLARNYDFWFAMLFFVLYTTCFVRSDSPARMQYLIAFVFTWAVGGTLIAMIFSSAGPVYYERLGLGPTFQPLMQILLDKAGPTLTSSVDLQNDVWRMYAMPKGFSVISAFPSMHVATSTLMVIIAFQFRRWAGVLMSIFAALIMLGSVMLGWHYAVDGYAGALIAVLCWKIAGWLIRSPVGPFGPSGA